MAMPAIEAFRTSHANAKLAILAKPSVAPLWQTTKGIDSVLTLSKGTPATFQMAKDLRSHAFQHALILPNSFRSALIPFLAHIPHRRGTAFHGRWALINDRVQLPANNSVGNPLHQALENHLILSNQIPANPFNQSCFQPPRPEAFDTRFAPDTLHIGIIPGAARGDSKRWTGFSSVAKGILQAFPNCQFAVMGTPNEKALCEAVCHEIGPSAFCLAGQTSLIEFAGWLASLHLVLCNDSGGMHLASAAGTPTVALFGLTDPRKTGPIGNHAVIIQAEGVVPSRKIARHCPAATQALQSIQPQRVLQTIQPILQTLSNSRL